MKRFLLIALLFLSAPALAAGDSIRVVNPDGSVSELKLPTAPAPKKVAPPAPAKVAPPPIPAADPRPRDLDIAIPSKSKARPAKDYIDPTPELAKAPAAKPALENKDPIAAPVATESMGRVVKAAPPKEKSDVKKAKGKKGKKEKAVEEVAAAPVEPQRPRGPITADEALRIALDVAPPARGYEIFRRDYNGRPAYMVTFKTENGLHDVLVDFRTGDVLKR